MPALKVRENPKLVEFKDFVYRLKPRYASLIAKYYTPSEFADLLVSAAGRNPELLSCSLISVLRAGIIAGQLGLDPTGVLGLAYLIPYKRSATFVIGYRGLMELARRSGQVAGISAHVVYNEDIIKVSLGTHARIVHWPITRGERGDIIGAYAVLQLTSGPPIPEWMTKDDIDVIRRRSRAGDSGPWQSDYPMMARKTVLKRLLRYAPLKIRESKGNPTEIAQATAIEDRFEEQGENATADGILPGLDLADDDKEIAQTKADEMAERLRSAREDEIPSQGPQPVAEGSEAAPSIELFPGEEP